MAEIRAAALPIALLGLVAACSVALAGDGPLRKDAAPSFVGTRAGQVRDDNGLKMKLVWCPPGKFTMGSPTDDKYRNDDENQVDVTLTKGFWLGGDILLFAEQRNARVEAPLK
jgi:formylglycine-generating enzyme required for sulfatase activity